MKYLLDLNVALAILYAGHEHSEFAVRWLQGVRGTGEVGVCRVVQLGLIRLLTHRKVMRDAVLTPSESWTYLDVFLSDDRIGFVEEPPDLVRHWRSICESLPEGACAEIDTYLAGLARSRDLAVVTFDGGFRKFMETRSEILASG